MNFWQGAMERFLRAKKIERHLVEIIYCDSEKLVLNKPAGVSVTRDRSGALELKDILVSRIGSKAAGELRLVHRLDKETSGVMLLARNSQCQRRLSGYFEKRLVNKVYLALVSGFSCSRGGRIESRLGPERRDTTRMRVMKRKGKEAVTDYKVLANFGNALLVAAYPVTGRTHQVRVHLAHAGLPLLIDPIYGGVGPVYLSDFKADYRLGKGKTEKPLIERLTLHAYQIELPGSEGGRCFVARPDRKFLAAVKMLTKHNPNGVDAFEDKIKYERILAGERLT